MRILILLCLLPLTIEAATFREFFANYLGNRAYEQGSYQDALESYSKSLSYEGDEAKVYANIGNVYAQNEDIDQAIQVYKKAALDLEGNDLSSTYYNLGNMYMQKQDLENAVAHYIEALKLNPQDTDVKHNLEFALRQMQEQQQQQQNQDGEGDENNEEEQQQEQQQQQDGDDENQNQQQQQQSQQQHSEDEQKKETAKQMLEFLTEKEKQAREKYLKRPVQEMSVEKDW
jgi:Ca-activated chloride channel family protein